MFLVIKMGFVSISLTFSQSSPISFEAKEIHVVDVCAEAT